MTYKTKVTSSTEIKVNLFSGVLNEVGLYKTATIHVVGLLL